MEDQVANTHQVNIGCWSAPLSLYLKAYIPSCKRYCWQLVLRICYFHLGLVHFWSSPQFWTLFLRSFGTYPCCCSCLFQLLDFIYCLGFQLCWIIHYSYVCFSCRFHDTKLLLFVPILNIPYSLKHLSRTMHSGLNVFLSKDYVSGYILCSLFIHISVLYAC